MSAFRQKFGNKTRNERYRLLLLAAEEAGPPTTDEHWANVALALQFDGLDTATTSTDDSDNNHAVSFTQNAQLDTAQKKFGESSLLLDGALDFVFIASHATMQPAAESFTVELHARFNSMTKNPEMIISRYTASGNNKEWLLSANNATSKMSVNVSSTGGNDLLIADETFAWSLDTWYHLAFVIDRDEATDVTRLFVDGVQLGTDDTTVDTYPTINSGTGTTDLGRYNAGAFNWFDGWIDNVRITKGVARYKTNFTPPTAPYPTTA